MAERQFKLPGVHELNKDQEDVRALPLEGQHLIVGGPGTGKSVMALLRAKRLHEENKEYRFLVYNRLLIQSNRQMSDTVIELVQWQSWFRNTFKQITGQDVPRSPLNSLNFLWDQALEIIPSTLGNGKKHCLIIDEGQDMPPKFYQCIAKLGFEDIFVVADQNQTIEDGENSSRRDLEDMLGLDTNDVIELKKNYRNTYPIARLAREFYTGDPASPLPELPPLPQAQSNTPLLFLYPEKKFEDIIHRMLKKARNNPKKLLGLIAPNNNIRKHFYKALDSENNKPGIEKINISTYKNGDKHVMRFDEDGIMVINCQACKGLEFDTVFIIGLNEFFIVDDDSIKKRFYVMIARAIDTVIMLQKQGASCPVETILPQDPQVLERK